MTLSGSWTDIAGVRSTVFCGRVNEKTLPFPYSLSTVRVPFISATSLLHIASPRPVPSTFLFLLESTCWKDSNILPRSSFLIPIPVSRTLTLKLILSASRSSYPTLIRTWPLLVNLAALPARLISTCLIRFASPDSLQGRSGTISRTSSIFLSPILVDIIPAVS